MDTNISVNFEKWFNQNSATQANIQTLQVKYKFIHINQLITEIKISIVSTV